MELEYDHDREEYIIVIPESLINRLDWEEDSYLEYLIEDDMLKLFTTED